MPVIGGSDNDDSYFSDDSDCAGPALPTCAAIIALSGLAQGFAATAAYIDSLRAV